MIRLHRAFRFSAFSFQVAFHATVRLIFLLQASNVFLLGAEKHLVHAEDLWT